MNGKKNKKIKKMILLLIFIAGSSVCAYPLIANLINTRNQTKIISNYESELEKLSEEERLEKIEAARAYNEVLNEGQNVISDPFDNGMQESQEISFIDIGEIMGYVEIPKLDIKLPIYQGTSETVLQKGIGWLEGTSVPIGGESTHSVLSGHRGLPTSRLFTDLDKLENGDNFFIRNADGILAYEVDQIKIVLPDETEDLLIIEGKEYVTLLTCHPYMVNSHRMLVRGHRIPYTNQLDENYDGKEEIQKISFFEKYKEYIYIIGAAVAFFFLLFIIKKIIRRWRKRSRQDR